MPASSPATRVRSGCDAIGIFVDQDPLPPALLTFYGPFIQGTHEPASVAPSSGGLSQVKVPCLWPPAGTAITLAASQRLAQEAAATLRCRGSRSVRERIDQLVNNWRP